MIRQMLTAAALAVLPVAAPAETPRDTLTQTAFAARDKSAALRQVEAAAAAAAATLVKAPGDAEAQLTRAMATSYRAKLTQSRSEALSAKAQFEALAKRRPQDPEAQAALGAWHLNAVEALGGMMARAALGARKATGIEATDRAVALGGDRALFPGIAALLRLAIDPRDARGAALAETAAKGSTPTTLDRFIQRRAVQMVATLKGGDAKRTQALAKRLLPLGQFGD